MSSLCEQLVEECPEELRRQVFARRRVVTLPTTKEAFRVGKGASFEVVTEASGEVPLSEGGGATIVSWPRVEHFQIESLRMIIEEMLIHSPKYATFAQGAEATAPTTAAPTLEEVGTENAANVSLETTSVKQAADPLDPLRRQTSSSISPDGVAPSPSKHGTHTGLQLIMPGNVLSQLSWELPAPQVLYASQHNPGAVAIAESLANSPLLVSAVGSGHRSLRYSSKPPGALLRTMAANQSKEQARLRIMAANRSKEQACQSLPPPIGGHPDSQSAAGSTQCSATGPEQSWKSRANERKALVKQHSVRRPNQRWVALDANLGTRSNQQRLREKSPTRAREKSPTRARAENRKALQVRHCEVTHPPCGGAQATQPELAPPPASDATPTSATNQQSPGVLQVDSDLVSPSAYRPSPNAQPANTWLHARCAMRMGVLSECPWHHQEPTCMLLALNKHVFAGSAGETLALEVAAALEAGFPILTIHVADLPGQTDGSRFERFFAVTPPSLILAGLYKPLAVPWYADEPHINVSHALALKSLDATVAKPMKRRGTAINALRRVSQSTRTPPTLQSDTPCGDKDLAI